MASAVDVAVVLGVAPVGGVVVAAVAVEQQEPPEDDPGGPDEQVVPDDGEDQTGQTAPRQWRPHRVGLD